MVSRFRCPKWPDILVAVGVLTCGLLMVPVAQADIMGFSGGDPNLWTVNHATIGTGDLPMFDPSTDSLIITTDVGDEHNSAFYSPADQTLPQLRQSVTGFMATFTFQVSGTMRADGAAFVWQNDPFFGPQAVGTLDGGSALGYQGIQSSAAIAFNVYSQSNPLHIGTGHAGETDFLYNDQFGNVKNPGGNYLDTTPVELTTNGPITVTLMYDNVSQNLVETLTDTAGNTFTQTYTGIDLPTIVGDTTAYIGFTGGTGGATAVQTFSNFMYIEMPPP